MSLRGIIDFKEPSLNQKNLWLRLTKDRYRSREGLLLAEGMKVVEELLKSPWTARAILVDQDKSAGLAGFLGALKTRPDIYRLSPGDFRKLSQDKESEGIMAVAALPPAERGGFHFEGKRDRDLLLLLYRINNPQNLGAILRSARWFGVKTVVVSSGSVEFTHPKAVRASMGGVFHLEVITGANLVDLLPALREEYHLIAAVPRGGVSPHPRPAGNTALILGSETHGLPGEILEMVKEQWTIPARGPGESLSLPQAAAIVLYEASGV